jgi:ATP-dependent helicase HrpB
MAAFGTHPRLARMLLRARELESEGLTGIVADAAFLVALLEEDLRGSERLSVLFHRRQGALRQGRPAGSSGSASPRQPAGSMAGAAVRPRLARSHRQAAQWQPLSAQWRGELRSGRRSSCQGQGAIVAVEMGQNERGSRIFIAEPVALDELVRQLPELVGERQWFDWDDREERVRGAPAGARRAGARPAAADGSLR